MTRDRIIRIVLTLAILGGLIWLAIYLNNKSEDEVLPPVLSVSSYNQTKNVDASVSMANPKDVIVYAIKATNPNDKIISGFVMEVSIDGIVEGATLTDAQGANFNSENNTLSWTPLDISASESMERQFTVRVKDVLPADKTLRITYGNEVVVNLENKVTSTPNVRPGSSSGYKAPSTGIPGWVSFYLACFITFGILLFRTARKMGKPTN
jgi:hypothetical protein